jgi:hypothetical protein
MGASRSVCPAPAVCHGHAQAYQSSVSQLHLAFTTNEVRGGSADRAAQRQSICSFCMMHMQQYGTACMLGAVCAVYIITASVWGMLLARLQSQLQMHHVCTA